MPVSYYGGDVSATSVSSKLRAGGVALAFVLAAAGCGGSSLTVEEAPTATPAPTAVPTATPEPTPEPTEVPTATPEPTEVPTEEPTAVPTEEPTPEPEPTEQPESGLVEGNAAGSIVEAECYEDGALEVYDDPVPCDQPHRTEVYWQGDFKDLGSATFPGDEAMIDRGSVVCNDAMRDVFGVRGEITVLRIRIFRPSEASWDVGDRELLCFVQYEEDLDVELRSLDPLRAFGGVSPFALEVGDCIVEDDLGLNPMTLIDCADDHYYEVYVSDDLGPGSYPGDDPMDIIVEDLCLDTFEGFVGLNYSASEWFIEPLQPTEATWDTFDDRRVTCLLTKNQLVSGTAEGSAV